MNVLRIASLFSLTALVAQAVAVPRREEPGPADPDPMPARFESHPTSLQKAGKGQTHGARKSRAKAVRYARRDAKRARAATRAAR